MTIPSEPGSGEKQQADTLAKVEQGHHVEPVMEVPLTTQAVSMLQGRFDDPREIAADATKALAMREAQTPTTPTAYRRAAREFLALADRIAGDHDVAMIPWAFVLGQTLECILKAYLTQLKRTLPKSPDTHYLIRLWEEAAQASGAAAANLSIDPTPPDWCVILAAFHNRPFLDRYSWDDGLAVGMLDDWKVMTGRLRALLQEVEAAFQ